MDEMNQPDMTPTEIALIARLVALGYSEDMVSPFVDFGGRTYSVEDAKFMRSPLLAAAVEAACDWGDGREGVCRCRWPFRLLSAKHPWSVRPHLACYPGDALNHAFRCPFHTSWKRDTETSWTLPAADRDLADRLRINFVMSLDGSRRSRWRPEYSGQYDRPQSTDAPSAPRGQRSMKPLGLLLSIANEAKLQNWNAEVERTYAQWRSAMFAAAQTILIDGTTLSQYLLIADADDEAKSSEELVNFRGKLGRAPGRFAGMRRGVVIGEIEKISMGNGGATMQLKGLEVPLLLGERVVKKAKRSFGREWSAPKTIGSTRICIAVIGSNSMGGLEVLRIAIARASRDYILVESIVEAIVVNDLVDEGRRFLKPVRPVKDLPFRPDILLLDTPKPPMPMEVYAFWTPRYLREVESKKREYKRLGIEVWEWDGRGERPALPARIGCEPNPLLPVRSRGFGGTLDVSESA